MKLWSKVTRSWGRLTNLEVLMSVLTLSLTLYLGSILPSYIKPIKVLQEEGRTYKEFIQILKAYELGKGDWKERDRFLNLCLEGYVLDFPQEIDEYLLLGIVEGYLNDQPVRGLEVKFMEIQDRPPFKHYVYRVKYVSSERVTRDIARRLPSAMEGITIRELHILASSAGDDGIRNYTTEFIMDIACQ